MDEQQDWFSRYLSPFSWRYGSDEMRFNWSEKNKRLIWRKLWIFLAQVESEFGLVRPNQLADLRDHAQMIDIARALEIEHEIQHDLMAELKAFAEQCPVGGGILHLGATSMDIEDNADVLRIKAALIMIMKALSRVLALLADKIELWADIPVLGLTHLQPAAPTTLGYRFSLYAQDLFEDWKQLSQLHSSIKGKGFKGAVGTSATFAELIGLDNVPQFDSRLRDLLGIDFFPVTGQTYPRKQDYVVLSVLAGIGASLHKLAFDLRILQSPALGEISEPFGRDQVGSSAMPFKRNPVQSEKINSLARALAQMPRIAWDNAANSLLERTLDDSANRRSLLAEGCLICDELISVSYRILKDLIVDENAISANLSLYRSFTATEQILAALVARGADRQEMHELLRKHSMKAWEAIRGGLTNPLPEMVTHEPAFQAFASEKELFELMNMQPNLGLAPNAARSLAAEIKATIF